MSSILFALNHDDVPPRRDEMRRLVEAWNDCGRDAQKVLDRCQELKAYLWDEAGRPRLWAMPFPRGSGLNVLVMVQDAEGETLDNLERDDARKMFIELLLNPLREKLSERPCERKQCGRYYFKNTARRKVYCSRKCAKDDSASSATNKRLGEERKDKIERANAAAAAWLSTRTKLDWRHWVTKQHPDITLTFLTQGLNKGKISEPRKVK